MNEKPIFLGLGCHICELDVFLQKRNLRQYYLNAHKRKPPTASRYGKLVSPPDCKFVKAKENATGVHYKCSPCIIVAESLILFGQHVDNHLDDIVSQDPN